MFRSFRYRSRVEVFGLDLRNYCNANTADQTKPGYVLGDKQACWLANALDRRTATWKIVQADLPVGLVVPDGTAIEAVADNLPGARRRPRGGAGLGAARGGAPARAQRRVADRPMSTTAPRATTRPTARPSRTSTRSRRVRPAHCGRVRAVRPRPDVRPQSGVRARADDAELLVRARVQHFGELHVDGGSGDLRDATGKSRWSKTLHPQGR
ncbi:alkaline phosphatase D family protein [Amycolatopsis sp. NPDC023774]|uniref:alkaline phosphatase D family protein n=1 Tax=Amycolatopsis sp. NPDC023774 TaxID=3155015 RepID=UPI0033D26A9F